uniref:Uncharacterized protein n=1 Tax=Glossina palpalis gambiensis TaxID=67801 RepID=A0A1B0B109_9MUSC
MSYSSELDIILVCFVVLRHRRHNKLVIDYVDLVEEAFSNEDEPVDLMFRFRCSTFMRFLVKMLLIVFCVTNSYLVFDVVTTTIDDFINEQTVAIEMMGNFILVIILVILCIPDMLCHIAYIALIGNILFLVSLGLAFKCPLDYQFSVDPMRDLWSFKIWPMTVFIVPLLTQVTAFVIPLRFEMETSKHLRKPPYMVDSCVWILALILCGFLCHANQGTN